MLVMAADYPFMDVLWTMLILAALAGWIWTVVVIFGDLIARRDIRGGIKAGWIIILLLIPFVGTLLYVVTNHEGMAERSRRGAGPSAEIARAQELLDRGAITAGEFEVIKAKAMA